MRPAATRHKTDPSAVALRKPWIRAYARYVFAAALAISLLLHVSLLTGLHFYLPQDTQRTDVIEARLQSLPQKPAAQSEQHSIKRAAPKKRKTRAKAHPHAPSHKTPVAARKPEKASVSPTTDKTADSASVAQSAVMTVPAAQASVSAATGSTEAPVDTAAKNAAPVSPDSEALDDSSDKAADATTSQANKLPDKFEIEYTVTKGIDGFPLGRATYLWVAQDGQYTLTSITEGSGLFALFQPGKLVQISRGKINATGLAPDDFWIQRGRSTPDKTTSAHFDYINRNVTITKDNRAFSVPMEDNAQDLLSAIFQLAVRAPFPGTMLLHVTSGKSLKPYHARIVGEETIATPLGPLRTLHLVRPAEDDEDAMDLWLAEDYNDIPVKIRIDHSKFGIIEQTVTNMQTR